MSQDLRLYSLSLILVLMLWATPGRADYGSECPALAVPVSLSGGDVWASYDEDGWSSEDYRDLYPYDAYAETISGTIYDYDCVVEANSGTYYDGANHLWVLDDDLTCDFLESGNDGDFRAGEY